MHYAHAIVAAARRNGMDVPQLLDAAGLCESVAENVSLRMTASQFSKLLLQFWHMADDEYLGMASTQCRQGAFTMMAKQSVSQPCLRDVFKHIARFYRLIGDGVQLRLGEGTEESRFYLHRAVPERDPDHMLVEFFLMLWHRFPSWLIGQRITLRRTELSYPQPAHWEEFELIFPCPVTFDSDDNSLVFDTAWLDKPVVQSPDTLREHLLHAPLNWITRQAFSPHYTRRAMDYLENIDAIGDTRIDELAAMFHMTSRTLHRRLSEERTSFQEIKDRVRRDRAIHQLSHEGKRVSEISRDLGFSDTAAFSRAFKTWTGVSPSDYRRQ